MIQLIGKEKADGTIIIVHEMLLVQCDYIPTVSTAWLFTHNVSIQCNNVVLVIFVLDTLSFICYQQVNIPFTQGHKAWHVRSVGPAGIFIVYYVCLLFLSLT